MKIRHLKWHDVLKAGEAGDECYLWEHAKTGDGYGRARFNGRKVLAHRLSYEIHVGPIPKCMEIDHACGVRLCIAPLHLRPVTHKANGEHRTGMHARNTSGWRGVRFVKATGKWRAEVGHNGKLIHVGYFTSAEEAGLAAAAKRRELGFLE